MENVDEYRCWFELLKLSDRGKWSEKVEAAFGDAAHLPFRQWLKAMRPSFERLDQFTIQEVTGPDQFEHFNQEYPREDGVIVFLHLLAPKTALLAAVRQLLDERHAGKPGRPKREDWAEIQMARKPNVAAINKAIKVYKAVNFKHPHLPHWRIGEIEKVNLSRLEPLADEEDERYRKRVLSITVANLLKRADVLIRGVERGVFPAKDHATPCPW